VRVLVQWVRVLVLVQWAQQVQQQHRLWQQRLQQRRLRLGLHLLQCLVQQAAQLVLHQQVELGSAQLQPRRQGQQV
jgi:hypothetical protein